jgi:hypothetical protein
VNGRGVADVAAYLLSIAASCEVAHAHCGPAEFSHQGGKVPITTRSALALWDLEDVHQHLCADTFQAIEPCRPLHALQAQTPRVCGLHEAAQGPWPLRSRRESEMPVRC